MVKTESRKHENNDKYVSNRRKKPVKKIRKVEISRRQGKSR